MLAIVIKFWKKEEIIALKMPSMEYIYACKPSQKCMALYVGNIKCWDKNDTCN